MNPSPLLHTRHRRLRRTTGFLALALAAPVLAHTTAAAAPSSEPASARPQPAYRGSVEVVPGPDEDQTTIDGTVYVDRDRDSVRDRDERGLRGVTVSNGRDVTTTDGSGRYRLPAYDNMTVFVTQPRGYQVPLDDDNVPQFFYHHLPGGSPELRYGGIEPTGPLPDEVNFPVGKSPSTASPHQSCVIGGDIQTYDLAEVEYARRGAFADLAARDDYAACGTVFIGDVVGDDLSLYPKTRELAAMLNGPAWFLPGNHDLDFDATDSEHSFDTFRAQLAPEYYSFDVGKVHVVALNTVDYPTPSGYNGAIDARQLAWLRNDIARVPRNRLVVVASHIPLLDFADEGSAKHQVDQVREVYEILEGRPAVAVAGHTHSIENLRAGDSMAGWSALFGVDALPFTHITSGAISGDWFSGRLLPEGYPTAIQRDGGRPGVLTLEIDGTRFRERFTVRGEDPSLQMALGLNTPRYRAWYAEHVADAGSAPAFEQPLVVSRDELAGTWLTTNFWMGSTGSSVEVSIDGRRPVEAVRTQEMAGEAPRIGAEWSDPVAVQEQLVHGGSIADRSMHLWRLALPDDLSVGRHVAEVVATDVHGRSFTETIAFRVTG